MSGHGARSGIQRNMYSRATADFQSRCALGIQLDGADGPERLSATNLDGAIVPRWQVCVIERLNGFLAQTSHDTINYQPPVRSGRSSYASVSPPRDCVRGNYGEKMACACLIPDYFPPAPCAFSPFFPWGVSEREGDRELDLLTYREYHRVGATVLHSFHGESIQSRDRCQDESEHVSGYEAHICGLLFWGMSS